MKFIKYVLKVSFIILPFFVFSQKKDILSVMKSQEKSWNNGDLKGYMKGYYQSDSLIFVSNTVSLTVGKIHYPITKKPIQIRKRWVF